MTTRSVAATRIGVRCCSDCSATWRPASGARSSLRGLHVTSDFKSRSTRRSSRPRRIVVGMTGASGVVYGVRLLEVLGDVDDVETHLVISGSARRTLKVETDYTAKQVAMLADVTYRVGDIGAALASGSFRTDGMVVVPCTVKTLSGI